MLTPKVKLRHYLEVVRVALRAKWLKETVKTVGGRAYFTRAEAAVLMRVYLPLKRWAIVGRPVRDCRRGIRRAHHVIDCVNVT